LKELAVGVWELRCASVNDFAMLVSTDRADGRSGMFDADGTARDWMHRPAVEFYVEPRKKVQKPRADVSLFRPGALVLNAKVLAINAMAKERQDISAQLEGGGLDEEDWEYRSDKVLRLTTALGELADLYEPQREGQEQVYPSFDKILSAYE
jgi:hypothetical protein